MNESCQKLLADMGGSQASDVFSDHYASANEKVGAYKCSLGIGRTKQMVRYASPHKMAQMIRRGLANPPTKPYERKPRADFRAALSPVDGASPAEYSQWWFFLEKAGLAQEASRGGWGEVLTQLQEGLLFSPEDLRETSWDLTPGRLGSNEGNVPKTVGPGALVSCQG